MAKPVSRTERNLWSAFLGEAKANRLYVAYAMKAMEEGHPETAQVFMEAAGAETIHAISHLKTLGEMGTTQENLVRVTEGEAYEINSMYPRMIREADEEGRKDAVESFRLAWDRERHHLHIFEEASERLSKKLGKPPLSLQQRPAPTTEAQRTASPAAQGDLAQEVHTEKERVAGRARIREVVFGMQDGLISTLALLSSVFGAVTENYLVIVAGLAAALAGMISMAMGSYLSSKAEREVMAAEIAGEAREIEQKPAEELAELIEIYRQEGLPYDEAVAMAEKVAIDRKIWLNTLVEKELGISPHLTASPTKDAIVMGASFIGGAIVPLAPYFVLKGLPALGTSMAVTGVVLFLVGFAKGRLTQGRPLFSGLEILIIGSLSAILGYGLGTLLPRLVGAPVAAG